MKHRVFGLLLGMLLLAAASPARAANKEHQQLMADLRMLQEQSQQLQNLIGSVTEALKAVNSRLDQQAEATRKNSADQKLVIDNLTNDVRVIREKLDDNNVRIGSLTQEVESLRSSIQQSGVRPSVTNDAADPAAPGAAAGGPPPSGVSPGTPLGVSPQKLFDSAMGDYYSGQYDLAVLGFSDYIKSFPKSDLADDAQVNICSAYVQDGKNDKAVEACDLAIRTYPNGDKIPDAYYKKGLALQNLRDVNGAREAWEHVVKTAPDSDAGRLAKQRLDQIKRPN
jgi:TolA-binding protein